MVVFVVPSVLTHYRSVRPRFCVVSFPTCLVLAVLFGKRTHRFLCYFFVDFCLELSYTFLSWVTLFACLAGLRCPLLMHIILDREAPFLEKIEWLCPKVNFGNSTTVLRCFVLNKSKARTHLNPNLLFNT